MIENRIENVPTARLGANPPGTRAAAKALVVFLCCLAALAVVGCATRPFTVKPDDPLFGTWVSTAVDEGKERGFAKTVMTPDGRELDYYHIADTTPAVEGAFVIEEAWKDRLNYRWYKITGKFWSHGTDGQKTMMYMLVKVSPDGNTIESAGQQVGYPDKVEPVLSPNYGIAYRQK